MRALVVLFFFAVTIVAAPAWEAPSHRCAADAVTQSKKLLTFYLRLDEPGAFDSWSVDESARQIDSVPAIRGTQRYDVFEVWGRVYKGRYRMRFLYALSDGACALMGEEIMEDATL
jgi:hypothetical protein